MYKLLQVKKDVSKFVIESLASRNEKSLLFLSKSVEPIKVCRLCCSYSEYCMVHDDVWDTITSDMPKDILLCFDCMQEKLGRNINLSDLQNVPCNEWFFRAALM